MAITGVTYQPVGTYGVDTPSSTSPTRSPSTTRTTSVHPVAANWYSDSMERVSAPNPFSSAAGRSRNPFAMNGVSATAPVQPQRGLTATAADARIEQLANTINNVTNNLRTNPEYTAQDAAQAIRDSGFYAEDARVFPSLQASAGGPLPDQGNTPAPEFMAGALQSLAANNQALEVQELYANPQLTRNPDGSVTANSWNNAAYLGSNGETTPFLAQEAFTFAQDGNGQWRVTEHNILGQTFEGQPRPDNAPNGDVIPIAR